MSNPRLSRCLLPAAFLLLAAAAAGAQQQGPQPVRVSSARDLLRAIGPDATIVLAPGDYDLSRARDVRSRWISWQGTEAGQDFEVVIEGAGGLTLQAEEGARLLTPPPYAWVLTFRNCRALRLERLAAGHSGPGTCVGGVLRLERCREVTVEGGDFWGSGAVGLSVEDCDGVTVRGAVVRGCTVGAVWVRGSRHVDFDGVELRGNAAWPLIEVASSSGVRFEGCTVRENRGDTLFAMGEGSEGVFLPGTTIADNEVARFSPEDLPLPDTSGTKFSGNLFEDGGESGEDYFESEYIGEYPGEADDLGLDLPAGWIPGPGEDWPGAVLLVHVEEDLSGLFTPLEAESGGGEDAGSLRAAFRRALEVLRQATVRWLGQPVQLQAGPVRVVSEGECRQEVFGTSRGSAGVDPRGREAVRGQILRAGDSFYATVFAGDAQAMKDYAEELEEVRAALEVLIGD